MDFEKLSSVLVKIGALGVTGAVIWWTIYFEGISFGALPCLVGSSGNCGLLFSIGSFAGKTAYNPLVFWAGAALVIVGIVMKISVKKEN